MKIGSLEIQNTSKLVNEDTRICQLLIAEGKSGKTTLSASLNNLTQKLYGKPTLVIAVEAGEGGGTASIEDFGVDYVCPKDVTEFDSIISALTADTKYAGVVLDSSTEMVQRIIKPFSLSFASREKAPVRVMGVPDRGDYQSMGEFMRQRMNNLINLTSREFMKNSFRKHVIVTARQKDKYNDNGAVIATGPDLPGQMAGNAVGMFQTISRIEVKTVVVPNPEKPGTTMRVQKRILRTVPGPGDALGDRYRILPDEVELTTADGKYVGFVEIWDKYWMPRIEKSKANLQVQETPVVN